MNECRLRGDTTVAMARGKWSGSGKQLTNSSQNGDDDDDDDDDDAVDDDGKTAKRIAQIEKNKLTGN